MNDIPKQRESTADELNGAHQRLEKMFKWHFWGATGIAVLGVVLFLGVYGYIAHSVKEPANTALVKQIELSNAELSRLTQAFLNNVASSNAPATADVLKAVMAQADAHQRAISELQAKEKETPKDTATFLQVLGGSVVLALLGYLGLVRLQSIDAEIQALREFMFKQISERVGEQKAILQSFVQSELGKLLNERLAEQKPLLESLIHTKVLKSFADKSGEIEELRAGLENQVASAKSEVVAAKSEVAKQTTDAGKQFAKLELRLSELLQKHPWLADDEKRKAVDDLTLLTSVEQAHNVAMLFRSKDDSRMAAMALRQIVERKLTGHADDFHNAHTEAFRIDEPKLALEIVNEGLQLFPDQYDLMADKARALAAVGKPVGAKTMIEDWIDRKPEEFARSWRPMTFYVDIVRSLELTGDTVERLDKVFSKVTQQLQYEEKPWSNYARFKASIGQLEAAEAIARTGLGKNPFSQELNYVLGDICMKLGRAEESVQCFERALRVDYQDTFQHSVSQDAIMASLAQAYEAAGAQDKAEHLYKTILHTDSRGHVREYAANRMLAILASSGGEKLNAILQQAQSAREEKRKAD